MLRVLRGKRVEIITPVPVVRSVNARCWSPNTSEKKYGPGFEIRLWPPHGNSNWEKGLAKHTNCQKFSRCHTQEYI